MEIQSRESCFWGTTLRGQLLATNKQWLREMTTASLSFTLDGRWVGPPLVAFTRLLHSTTPLLPPPSCRLLRHLGVLWGNNAPFHLLHENERLWGIYECAVLQPNKTKTKARIPLAVFQKWLAEFQSDGQCVFWHWKWLIKSTVKTSTSRDPSKSIFLFEFFSRSEIILLFVEFCCFSAAISCETWQLFP